jgi:hypothetical protein
MEWPVAGTTVTWKEPVYLSDTPCGFGPMHAEIKKLTKEGVFK